MLNFLITIALVALAIYLSTKRINPVVLYTALGLAVALGITLVTGQSVAVTSSGNIFLDIFEAYKETLATSFTSMGLMILPIYAYANYMNKIGAANVLGEIISKPILKCKNPYFVGIFITIIVCAVVRIAIVSAMAMMTLFLSTLYPALRKSGISKVSAVSAIMLGSVFDWGPADFTIAQMFAPVPGFNLTDYFLNVSLRAMPIVLIIVAAVSGFVFQFIDKKSGYVMGSDAPAESEIVSQSNLPKFYAILPLLPLILIFLFSPLVIPGINMSVVTAVLLSLLITLATECIYKKNVKGCIEDLLTWVKSIGEGVSNLLMALVALSFFAGMLTKLGGIDFVINAVLSAGVSGTLLLIVMGVAILFACLLLGQGSVVSIMVSPQLPGIADSMGVSFNSVAFPLQVANSMRGFNLGTSMHLQFLASIADTTVMELFKRLLIPSVLMYALSFVLSVIIL